MCDRDQQDSVGKVSGKIRLVEQMAAGFGILPEVLGESELELLNRVLAEMFDVLREAAVIRHAGGDRAAAIKALRAAWTFIARFQVGLGENLHASLIDLSSALEALNNNNVEPLLKPTPAPAGGRAPDSPARQALIGFAVGAVGRLQLAGLPRAAAHQAVADALHTVGIRPSRGSGRVTGRTVREWCERVAADSGVHSSAAMNAKLMLTEEWQAKIRAMPAADARKFTLDALIQYVFDLNLSRARFEKPSNPPS
jgi:hypothetical protein